MSFSSAAGEGNEDVTAHEEFPSSTTVQHDVL